MNNFKFYIFLICAVTAINSAKLEKKATKKKVTKITDEILEEEARKDIESLLKDLKLYADDDDDEYEFDDGPPTRTFGSSKTRSTKQNELLIEQIVRLINELDHIQRKGDNKSDRAIPWFDRPRSPGKSNPGKTSKPVLRSRYHQLMRHLATNHGNFIKDRLDSPLSEDHHAWSIKDNRYKQMMKSLDMKHRGVVKDRYVDEFGTVKDALRMRSDDKVLRNGPKKTIPELNYNAQLRKQNPATFESEFNSLKEELNDITFSDLLNAKYKQKCIKKRGGKKYAHEKRNSKQSDDIDIDWLLRMLKRHNFKPTFKKIQDPRYYKISSRMHSNNPNRLRDRFRRATQAGYTQDPDICKTYNDNLMKLWANLSKLVNVTEQPNERALHNIAIMIQAYLDHQNAKPTTETIKVKPEPPRDRVGEVIYRIRKLLDDDDGSSEKVTRTIIKYLKPVYEDAENSECKEVNEDSLTSSVNLLYRNYKENLECRNEEDGSSLNLRSRAGKKIQTLSGKWQTTMTNDDYRPEIKSILIEDELFKEINKGQVQRERPSSKFRRIFKRSKNTRSPSIIPRTTGQNTNVSYKPRIRARLHKPVAKKLRKSLLKTDLDKSKCEKYAIRKFIISLRPVIDRYMALLECELDNTLRSLNYDKVANDPNYLYASNYQYTENSQKRKPSLRQIFTRKNTGQITDHVTRKSQTQYRYDFSNENDNSLFEQTDEYSNSKQISAEKITGGNYISSVLDSFKLSNTDDKNEFSVKFNDDLQTPPKYDDYDGISKLRSDNTNISFNSQLKINQYNNNTSNNKSSNSSNKVDLNLREISNTKHEEDFTKNLNVTENKNEIDNKTAVEDREKLNLRNNNRFTYGSLNQNKQAAQSQDSIKDFLKNARDASLKTPEFAVPFALDSNKGYVELTHLVKYPKMIVYRPQFIVKNTVPYDDFLKTIHNINMTNDEVRLMKIVRHLPDSTVKVLFETEDFEAPLEVRNFRETRRWGLPITTINDLSETRTVEIKESDKSSDTDDDKDSNISVNLGQSNSNSADEKIESKKYVYSEKAVERQLTSNSDTYPTSDSDPNSPTESSDGIVIGPRTGLLSKISSGITSGFNSGIVSSISSTLESGLDSTKNIVSSLDPIPLINKLFPSYSNSPTIPPLDANLDQYYTSNSESQFNSEYNAHTHNSNSNTHSNYEPIVPNIENDSLELENLSPSSEPSYKGWWKIWRQILLKRLKKIIGSMTSLANNINNLVTK